MLIFVSIHSVLHFELVPALNAYNIEDIKYDSEPLSPITLCMFACCRQCEMLCECENNFALALSEKPSNTCFSAAQMEILCTVLCIFFFKNVFFNIRCDFIGFAF